MPWFDNWGWARDYEIPGRQTDVPVPADIPNGYAANWTGRDWIVIPYVEPVPYENTSRLITRLAFRNRFTQQEKTTIEFLSIDNPAATTQQRMQAAALRVYLQDIQASTFIDLERPDTRAGVLSLEQMQILATGRALQILDAPILEEERWNN